MNRLMLAGAAAALLSAAPARPDVVVMEDGRRLRGELVSVSRGTVVFEEVDEATGRRSRRRLPRAEVARIVFREADDARGGRMGRGRDDDGGPFGGADGVWREEDDGGDDEDGFRGGRGGEDDDDVLYRDDDRGRRGTRPWPEQSGRTRLVTVSARQGWTDTGLEVRVGDVLQFRAEGEVEWGAGRRDGPAGEANSPIDRRRPLPARPAGALLGRIGAAAGDVFLIGDDRGSFRVRTPGRLYLGINDDYLGDNAGSFQVRVSY